MANEEHLKILRNGADAWNKWRDENPSVIPNLKSANIRNAIFRTERENDWTIFANLSRADLDGADLAGLDLTGVNLHAASLKNADFGDADLYGTNLSDANLFGADFLLARLYKTKLSGCDMTNASTALSTFSDTSLAKVKLPHGTQRVGPCYIDVSTLELTAAELSNDASKLFEIETFLDEAGVPKEYIEFFRSRIGQPIQFYSAFISYSSKDQEFAEKLKADLRHQNVRCFLASEDLKIGDKFRLKINEQIRQHDKLVLILSEQSIESSWVEYEVKQAIEREKAEGKDVLFPIRIDDAVMETPDAWAAHVRKQRHIGDFRKWKDHDEYQKSLARLIRDLQAEERAKSSPA